jgi:starch phosphorylase
MSKTKRAKQIFPNLPERLVGLGDLAENLWWSWHPGARMLFKLLSRQAWKESHHNPDKMLKELPKEMLEQAAKSPEYLERYDDVLSRFREYIETKRCIYLESIHDAEAHSIAYLSAEYGLHHSLPFYAGGLGFLAGDFMKECSDLRLPLVAVGFMYPEGYFRQRIAEDGWQAGKCESNPGSGCSPDYQGFERKRPTGGGQSPLDRPPNPRCCLEDRGRPGLSLPYGYGHRNQ